MRVRLDENLPHDLKGLLAGHLPDTVAERGWTGVQNGELLKFASGDYGAFLTMDRRLPEQQHIAQLPFGIVLLLAPSSRLAHLRPLVPEILRILPGMTAGSLHAVGA